MRLRKIIACTCLSAGLFVTSPSLAATTFFNDWESQDFGSGPGFTILNSYEGWNRVSGGGIEVQYNNVAGQAFSGENLVELDSNGNSAMERLIDAGNYTLSFYYSPRVFQAATTNGIDVLVNGASIYSITGPGGPTTSWALQTVNFSIASSGSLRFAAIGTSDSLGGYIDDVRLASAIPEPATWAMMIGGLGLLGGALRRRPRLLSAHA